MKKIKWGIIGCGDVTEVKSGPAFKKVKNSELVAVMRRDADKAQDYARRHNVPKWYSDAIKLINDADVNAIYIATPPSSHEEYTMMAFDAGKPVYVEKPVSTNAASVERMIVAETNYTGKVAVAHYRRALPLFIKIKQLLTDDAIGKVKLILLKTLQPGVSKIITQTKDNWRIKPGISGGGLFHDLSPHQLDILYWLFGKPREVHIQTANQGKNYDAPDLTMVQLAFTDDVYFDGVWSFNVAKTAADDSCEIIGDKGSLRFPFFRPAHLVLTGSAGTEETAFETPKHIQQPYIENVVRFFRGEAENPCSLREAWITMQILDKAVL